MRHAALRCNTAVTGNAAASQVIPALQVGFLFTYIAPLSIVLVVSIGKEAYDDIQRWKRDKELNDRRYAVLGSPRPLASSELCVGHLVVVRCNERIPADMVTG